MYRTCTGCFILFPKMHLLLNHRRTFRCGGEWNETVYIPMHRYADGDMIYTTRPGAKHDPNKLPIPAPMVPDSVQAFFKRLKRKNKKRHKARTPGTVRKSRMPGGSSFRNNWEDHGT